MDTPDNDQALLARPWGARRPQNLFIGAAFVALAVALVWQALTYIGEGTGGVIPYILVIAGPVISGFYIWYFNFRDFEAD